MLSAKHLNLACAGRYIAMTAGGHSGLVPANARAGDVVAIFSGGCIPFILRRQGDCYHLVGTAYIDGIMNGEALDSGILSPEYISLK